MDANQAFAQQVIAKVSFGDHRYVQRLIDVHYDKKLKKTET